MKPWARYIRFVAAETNSVHYGEPIGADIDVGLAYEKYKSGESNIPLQARDLHGDPLLSESTDEPGDERILTVKKLLSPIDPGNVRTAMCLGFNYESHAKEAKSSAPSAEHPNYFHKPASSISDPSGNIVIPKFAQDSYPDYEGEIVAIIGRRAKNVSAAEASSYLLGYTLANDVSARTIQMSVSQASFGKSLDTFMPLGPVILNADQMPHTPEFDLQTELNGSVMQSASSREMISSIPELVEQLSRGTTLTPGTLILTGTPAGIGFRREPRVWLRDKDVVVIKGSHGLGSLYSHVSYD